MRALQAIIILAEPFALLNVIVSIANSIDIKLFKVYKFCPKLLLFYKPLVQLADTELIHDLWSIDTV